MKILRILFLASSLMLFHSASSAVSYGVLVGRVLDPQNKPIANVQLELYSEEEASVLATKTTDRAGQFAFLGVPPGRYAMRLEMPGWQSRRVSHLKIRSASTLDICIVLDRSATLQPMSDFDLPWGTVVPGLSMNKLPNSRTVRSLLENQTLSTVTDTLDIGGLKTGTPALFGALGASWTENEYLLDGFNVTDPYLPGRALFDPDLDALAAIDVISAAKPALFGGSGTQVAMTTPEPSENFHGTARMLFSNSALQSDNLDAELISFHFPGPEHLNHLFDGSLHLSGTLPFDHTRWPFFFSFASQQVSKNLGGFDAPIDGHIYSFLTEFVPISGPTKSLHLLYAGEQIFNSHADADPAILPVATNRNSQNVNHFQARWQSSVNLSTVLFVGFAATHATLFSKLQNEVESASTIDLPEGMQSGAAPLSTDGGRTRYQADAGLQGVHRGIVGDHSFHLGIDFERSIITNRWEAFGGIRQILVSGTGAEVVRWNTPAQSSQHVQRFTFFGQDVWRPDRWLAVPLGLRLQSAWGSAEEANNKIRWNTFEPRVGLIVTLTKNGPILAGSWSLYAHQLQGRYFDFGNPAALGGQVYDWQDSNNDRQVQPEEISQVIRVFGGPFSAVDKNLSAPTTKEITAGLQQNIGRTFKAGVRFFRRDTRKLVGLINTGVPISSYTPVIVRDPGNDGIFATPDDQFLTLYNEKTSALGRDFLLLTNPAGYGGVYKGLEIELAKQFNETGELTVSFAAMQATGPTNPGNSVFENDTGVIGSLGTDPNAFFLANGRTFFDRGFIGKLILYYRAPHRFRFGVVAKYYDGLPFGRLLLVQGFNQGPFFVRATPRDDFPKGFRTEFNANLDLRVAREFPLHRSSVSAYVDFFNLLNLNNNTMEAALTSPTFEKRVPLAIEAPRMIRLGFEWNF